MNAREIEDYLTRSVAVPSDEAAFQAWLSCNDVLEFLSAAVSDDVPVLVLGPPCYVNSVLIPAERLTGDYLSQLLGWNFSPNMGGYEYAYRGERPAVASSLDDAGCPLLDDSEPLCFSRHFAGYAQGRESYVEMNQKFVQASGAHWVETRDAFCHLNALGGFVEVIKVWKRGEWTLVTVNRDALDLYMYATRQVLVRVFDVFRLPDTSHLGAPGTEEIVTGDEDVIARRGGYFDKEGVSGGYVRGAQVIHPAEGAAKRFYDLMHWVRPPRQYASFIIHDWKHGRVVEWSTDPSEIGNYFVPSDLPFGTSPAFFRPEVLTQYKQDSERYTVDQWRVHCRGGWGLRYGLNDAGQVFAYIKNLSSIPFEEQLHWKAHNEVPKAPIPESAIKTDFLGEWPEIWDPLDEMKEILRGFPTATHRGQATVIWDPGKAGRGHAFGNLHYVLTDSKDDYVQEAVNLSKCVVEGLQTNPLRRLAEALECYDPKLGSIALIESCLRARGVDEEVIREVCQPLRDVQQDRQPGAHRSSRVVQGPARYRELVSRVRDSLKLLADLIRYGTLDI